MDLKAFQNDLHLLLPASTHVQFIYLKKQLNFHNLQQQKFRCITAPGVKCKLHNVISSEPDTSEVTVHMRSSISFLNYISNLMVSCDHNTPVHKVHSNTYSTYVATCFTSSKMPDFYFVRCKLTRPPIGYIIVEAQQRPVKST